MSIEFTIRHATHNDWLELLRLLKSCHLPIDDLRPENASHFLVAEHSGKIIGSIGHEPYEEIGLLRSLAVGPENRRHGIGAALIQAMKKLCKQSGVTSTFILTTTAETFAKHHGFSNVPRESVPLAIQHTDQFRSLCPSSAVCLSLAI